MKKILAYLLIVPYIIRANFLTAYRESMRQQRFVWRKEKPEFFKPLPRAIGDARLKALQTGIRWYVIEPAPNQFVAVSERYMQKHPDKKIIFKTS